MRLKNKYKVYTQRSLASEIFHKRLLNFKRPKWKKLQKALSFSISTKKLLSNNFYTKNTYKSWDKVKNYFKQGVKAKSNIYCHFDNSISLRHLNKTIKKKHVSNVRDLFVNCLLKPEFRIDILLWRLHFFNSSYQARQFINSGKVTINNKSVFGNVFLKKGDIITFLDSFNLKTLDLSENLKYFSLNKIISTFVEVDYYTNTIILVKDLSDLHPDDIYILNSELYDLKKIRDFL